MSYANEIPSQAIDVNIAPPPVSAQKPWYGRSWVNLKAIVFTILHPPRKVPVAIASSPNITHTGTTNDSESRNPPAINNAVITPIVFWPSFAPCVSEKNIEEPICSLPNTPLTNLGFESRRKYIIAMAKAKANAKPSVGDTTIKTNVFSMPPNTTASNPPAINAEPTKPPISAWLLEDGRPKYQVTRSHVIAPISPASMTYTVENSGCIIPLPTVAAAVLKINGPAKFATASHTYSMKWFQNLVPTTVAIALAES